MAKKKITPVEYILKNHTIENAPAFKIKKYLSPVEQLLFVDCIVDNVVNDEGYHAAMFDYSLRYATMLYFTDLKIPNGEDRTTLINELAYNSDLHPTIMTLVHQEQYAALVEAAHKQIESRTTDISAAIVRLLDNIGPLLTEKLKTLNLTENDMEILKEFAANIARVDERTLAHALAEKSKKI